MITARLKAVVCHLGSMHLLRIMKLILMLRNLYQKGQLLIKKAIDLKLNRNCVLGQLKGIRSLSH
jgi:hypothetical protein